MHQAVLPLADNEVRVSDAVQRALEALATAGVEERGAVFTRREVVDFILDLCGYTSNRKLTNFRLLEPSFGQGDFLLPIVERLLASYRRYPPKSSDPVRDLSDAVTAVEIHVDSVRKVGDGITRLLLDSGIGRKDAKKIVTAWLVQGDFLLTDLTRNYTHVLGNPPYVRQELIPDALIQEYRARYSTIYDRADLYVPFLERSLLTLADGGILGFICSDRWMKNRYGVRLRAMVSHDYHLRQYVDMVGTEAFASDVSVYPAITIIAKERGSQTRVAHRPAIHSASLAKLARAMTANEIPDGAAVKEITDVVAGSEPWILDSLDQLSIVRRIEADFPLIEDAGCRVGIGVATGADKAFIAPDDTLDVEVDRKLPLIGTRDIRTGNVQWRGMAVINPFAEDGSLVDLKRYPRLSKYLEKNKTLIQKRNCVKKNPARWYKTIDRIYPELTTKPKLLIPDIKGDAHVVYEDGKYYPHHNLYYIISDEWDLRALQAVLRSQITKLFVATYSTQMRGGYLRFQAQYLRRIHLPRWKNVSKKNRQALRAAALSGDQDACDKAAFRLYQLSKVERAALGGNGT